MSSTPSVFLVASDYQFHVKGCYLGSAPFVRSSRYPIFYVWVVVNLEPKFPGFVCSCLFWTEQKISGLLCPLQKMSRIFSTAHNWYPHVILFSIRNSGYSELEAISMKLKCVVSDLFNFVTCVWNFFNPIFLFVDSISVVSFWFVVKVMLFDRSVDRSCLFMFSSWPYLCFIWRNSVPLLITTSSSYFSLVDAFSVGYLLKKSVSFNFVPTV